MRLGAALLGVALLARAAAAEPITFAADDVKWQLDLPAGWTAAPLPELASGRALAAYASDGRRLLVARLRVNTDGAYQGQASYFAGVEDGVEKESAGYQRLSARVRKLGKRPAYDLWYRADGTVHGARFVFLRGSVVVLRLDLADAPAVERTARRILESFHPS